MGGLGGSRTLLLLTLKWPTESQDIVSRSGSLFFTRMIRVGVESNTRVFFTRDREPYASLL